MRRGGVVKSKDEREAKKLVDLFLAFYERWHRVPPGPVELVLELARNPRRYLLFCIELAARNPDAMHALIISLEQPEEECHDEGTGIQKHVHLSAYMMGEDPKTHRDNFTRMFQ